MNKNLLFPLPDLKLWKVNQFEHRHCSLPSTINISLVYRHWKLIFESRFLYVNVCKQFLICCHEIESFRFSYSFFSLPVSRNTVYFLFLNSQDTYIHKKFHSPFVSFNSITLSFILDLYSPFVNLDYRYKINMRHKPSGIGLRLRTCRDSSGKFISCFYYCGMNR